MDHICVTGSLFFLEYVSRSFQDSPCSYGSTIFDVVSVYMYVYVVREQRVTGILVFIMVGLSAFMAKVLKV